MSTATPPTKENDIERQADLPRKMSTATSPTKENDKRQVDLPRKMSTTTPLTEENDKRQVDLPRKMSTTIPLTEENDKRQVDLPKKMSTATLPTEENDKRQVDLPSKKAKLGKRLFNVLVLLGMGVESLERLTQITEDETEWKQFKEALASRIGNVNVVSALILASVAAFLTTSPATGIANWLHPFAYIVLLAALCLAYLAVGTGIFLLFILMDVRSKNLRNFLSGPKMRLGLGLGLTAAPVLFMGASGGISIVGLFAAVWVGNNAFAKAVLTIALVSVISLILGFVVIVF